jgi:antitoxin component of MazEF toxin-antitoxin module
MARRLPATITREAHLHTDQRVVVENGQVTIVPLTVRATSGNPLPLAEPDCFPGDRKV